MLMDDATMTTIKTIADLGGTVIVTVMLYLVWQRLNTVTDRLVEILAAMAKPQADDNEV